METVPDNRDRPEPEWTGPETRVMLQLLHHDALLRLVEAKEYSIGRVNEGQSMLPDIDLSAYDAYSYGVSRIHASLIITDKRVEVRDLGSSNGTTLNGRKLTPYVPYTLQDGDILGFGRLQARVILSEAPPTP